MIGNSKNENKLFWEFIIKNSSNVLQLQTYISVEKANRTFE